MQSLEVTCCAHQIIARAAKVQCFWRRKCIDALAAVVELSQVRGGGGREVARAGLARRVGGLKIVQAGCDAGSAAPDVIDHLRGGYPGLRFASHPAWPAWHATLAQNATLRAKVPGCCTSQGAVGTGKAILMTCELPASRLSLQDRLRFHLEPGNRHAWSNVRGRLARPSGRRVRLGGRGRKRS